MKSLNRTLSLVLVLVMVMGLFGIAGAAFTDKDQIENTEAVEAMTALNIINGKPNGSFDPTGIVTRAEMTKMICVALNSGKNPVLGTLTTPTYSDIKGNWAESYIEYCSKLGVVAGTGNGTFKPEKTVSGTEAAKMLLVAMGYDSEIEGFVGDSWEIGVNVRANQKDLFKNLSINPSAGLSRDDAAQMVYNALNALQVEYDYKLVTENGQVVTRPVLKDKALSLIEDKFAMDVAYGIITKSSYNKLAKKYTYTVAANTLGLDQAPAAIVSTKDYSGLFQMNAKVLYSGDTVYGVFAAKSQVVLGAVAAQLPAISDSALSFKLDGTTYKLSGAANTINVINFNTATSTTLDLAAGTAGSMPGVALKLIDRNGDGKIDVVVAEPYTVEKVTYVGTTTATTVAVPSGAPGSISLENDNVYEGIAKGDYVVKHAAANTVDSTDTYEKISLLAGKVEKTSGAKVSIGGVWMVNATGSSLSLGTEYEKIAQVNGFIYAATVKTAAVTTDSYAIVMNAAGASGLNGAQAKLFLSDGSTKIVDTAADYSGTLSAGTFVTFTENSLTNKYTLTAVAVGTTSTWTGYDKYVEDGADGDSALTYSYTNGTIEGLGIADNAVVFAKTSASSYKMITGAALKACRTATVTVALANTSKTTGYSTVVMVYADISGVATGSELYGYVTADVGTVLGGTDGKTPVSEITFWDGSKTVTKIASANYTNTDVVSAALAKGAVFSYTEDANGIITIVDADSGTAKVQFIAPAKAAVVAYDGGKNLMLTDNTGVYGTATAKKLTDKTVVIYIDSENIKGVEGGAISLATETAVSGTYTVNVSFLDTAVAGVSEYREVTLLLVDVANKMN